MGGLRCLDGSSLAVLPVAALDRGGTPFEVTLELRRDGDSFGAVGERCGHVLAALAAQVAAARAEDSPQAARWPDPDDRFPARPAYVPYGKARCPDTGADSDADVPPDTDRETELFAFRYRDRGDVASTGELRCTLRTSSVWVGPQGSPHGRWRRARRAVIEAWGAGGRGVRAVLTSAELARFLRDLLAEAERAGERARERAGQRAGAGHRAPRGRAVG
ncbi:hypothetical protein [Spirillospora sp. NPDC029432]|uniref:hypothetical protein n=1 Tax=Spirillospora sp. NPDC029432 TaxID=3154599 RepID=UPI003452EF30